MALSPAEVPKIFGDVPAFIPLAEAGKAHRLLESRQVSGKLLLDVSGEPHSERKHR